VPVHSRFLELQERVRRRGEARWRSADGERLYTWDDTHREVEAFNKRGFHLGALDPDTGVTIKPAQKGRRIDV
jgi:hypothetical protein